MKKTDKIDIRDLIDALGQPKEVDEKIYKRYSKMTLGEIAKLLSERK